jgi:hypothetical protein
MSDKTNAQRAAEITWRPSCHLDLERDIREALDDAEARGRAVERARVVAWLRSKADACNVDPHASNHDLSAARLECASNDIEAGEHEKP